MDIYTEVVELLAAVFPFSQWPEAQPLLERARANSQASWLLPVSACQAVGGNPTDAIPAATAIGCMHISIILIDDMLDADPRGEYHRIGEAASANLAAAFQAAGLEAITYGTVPPEIKLEALHSLNQMMLVTARGQYLDVQNPQDEAAYWELVRTKSSPFFGTALHIGALLGGAALDAAARIREFGSIYGEIVQIHDDLSDCMSVPANPDWILGRNPLPILYAQTVNHSERSHFQQLKAKIHHTTILAEAQEILIRCGAVSYCIHQLAQRYQTAADILVNLELASPEPLTRLLENAIKPVTQLLINLGVNRPEGLLQSRPPA